MKIEADLIVLSVGLRPKTDATQIAELFGIACDETGFFSSEDQKCGTSRSLKPGVFLAGTCREPMDIPDTVAEGGAAAMQVVMSMIRGDHATT
jgi:heterodisulfide reductase subunit A2